MKTVIAPIIIAIALAAVGAGFSVAGRAEQRLADVHHELATLQYTAASSDGEQVDVELGAARRLPQVGPQATADLRDARATASYWAGSYSAIAPQKDANGAVIETEANSSNDSNLRDAPIGGDENLERDGALQLGFAGFVSVLRIGTVGTGW